MFLVTNLGHKLWSEKMSKFIPFSLNQLYNKQTVKIGKTCYFCVVVSWKIASMKKLLRTLPTLSTLPWYFSRKIMVREH